MRKKSQAALAFVDGLHDFVIRHPQFRKRTQGKAEAQIQTELRPVLIQYLEKHFEREGYKDSVAKANKSFYWEGQEGPLGEIREPTFGGRNYPDFIVQEPYLIAVEYKQSESGSLVKHGIGQSMMHTLSGQFDFVYLLFHDESPDKRIQLSSEGQVERGIIERMWTDFNIYIRFV